jgi:hypothetical protein
MAVNLTVQDGGGGRQHARRQMPIAQSTARMTVEQ